MTKKAVLISVIILGVLSIIFHYTGMRIFYCISKPLTTISIILLAVLYGRREVFQQYWWFLTFGLFFCLAGDICLLWESMFVYGLGLFLVAHILFTVGFSSVYGWSWNWISLLLLIIYGASFFTYLLPALGFLLIPVGFYTLFIILTAWQGIGIWIRDKQEAFRWILWGVIFFILSDTFLAINKFIEPFPLAALLTLASYWTAVALFAYSTTVVTSRYAQAKEF